MLFFSVTFFLDDGWERGDVTKKIFANNANDAWTLLRKRYDEHDILELKSIEEIQIKPGLVL